ncbi:hypothetical protein NL676_025384 [Syzygium grande]|nr:hypothetical protein NL676_025384 [Syzygium grande]
MDGKWTSGELKETAGSVGRPVSSGWTGGHTPSSGGGSGRPRHEQWQGERWAATARVEARKWGGGWTTSSDGRHATRSGA